MWKLKILLVPFSRKLLSAIQTVGIYVYKQCKARVVRYVVALHQYIGGALYGVCYAKLFCERLYKCCLPGPQVALQSNCGRFVVLQILGEVWTIQNPTYKIS